LLPYFMMHGVELIFPFDLAEAMFLAPLKRQGALMTTELIAWRTRQLQKHMEDLEAIRERVVAVRFMSICKFEKCFHMNIKLHNFQPGAYVLVHSSKVEYELSKKTKLHYLRPMVVVRCMKGGSYMLAEFDGTISKFHLPHFVLCHTICAATSMYQSPI